MGEKIVAHIAKSLQCQLNRTGHHIEIEVLKSWIQASVKRYFSNWR